MDRDNFYIILELDFDKPEEDMNIINAAIEAKQAEWSKNRNHPRLGTKMLQYLSMIDQIRQVMSDGEMRRTEALTARKTAYEPLDRQIAVICQKKRITSAEIDFLSKKYKLNRDKVLSRVPKNIEIAEDKKDKTVEKLDTVIVKKISDNLEIINKNSLYEFLELPASSRCAELSEKAEEMYSTYAKKPKSAENEAVCALAGICKTQFSDQKKRALYDEYLKEKKLDDIKEMIDLSAAGGEINQAAAGEIIKQIMPKGYDYTSAVEVLKEYCMKKRYCVVLPSDGKSGGVPLKRCGVCGANVEISENIRACTACGAPLFVECPKCKTVNESSNNNCLKCGFSIKNMFVADRELSDAKRYIDEMSFIKAAEALKRAEQFYPGRADTQKLEKQLETLRKDTEKYKTALDMSIADRKFYFAYEQYKMLKNKMPGYSDQMLENQIKSAVKSARELAERAQIQKSEKEAVDLCVRALEICADCAEARNILLGYELKPARNICININGMINTVRWERSESCGRITYKVVKKAYSQPKDENDGMLLCDIDGTEFEDRQTSCAEPAYYAVFASRGGIVSKSAAAVKPVYNFYDISDVRVMPADRSVTLSWNMPNEAKSFEIWRGEEFIPTSDQPPAEVFKDGGALFNDEKLTNGTKYFYKIFAVYNVGGDNKRSGGVTVKAIPNVPPKPVRNITFQKNENKTYSVRYTEPENGNFILYCSADKNVYSENDVVSVIDAEKKLKKLAICGKSNGKVEFKPTNEDIIYVYPAVVCGESAAFCGMITVSNVKSFENPSKPKFGTDKMYIEFGWPKEADAALVLYKFDGYAKSPDDKSAMREYITKKSYEMQAAAVIPNIQKRTYYITIFAAYGSRENPIYSDGINIFASNEGVTEINYIVKPKKTLFGKIKGFYLEIWCRHPLNSLPVMQLVKKSNILPLNKNDGTAVLTTNFTDSVNKEILFFEDNPVTKTTCYKLFFEDESSYERYKITTTNTSGLTVVK